MADTPGTTLNEGPPPDAPKGQFRFPTAFTVLLLALLLVWVASLFVPAGFQSASGFVNLVTPTSAVIMGGLALSMVGYDKYLRFVWPFRAVVFVIVCAFLGIAAATA
jgi:uncharacterized ion transporter superfamily protein YfcC